jgi:hypothetical protein
MRQGSGVGMKYQRERESLSSSVLCINVISFCYISIKMASGAPLLIHPSVRENGLKYGACSRPSSPPPPSFLFKNYCVAFHHHHRRRLTHVICEKLNISESDEREMMIVRREGMHSTIREKHIFPCAVIS